MEGGPLQWYYEIPVVSRVYLTGSLLTTSLVALEVVSPYAFYFNWEDIMRGEIWRLVTDFLFFGSFSLDFLFHMYFLVRYCRLLEEGEFRGRTADFVFFLLFGAVLMTMVAPLLPLYFLGLSLTFMMVYVWGRRNEHVRLSFLGLFPFTAPYLPWVLLGFSLLLNNTSTLMTDIVGIAVGHIYYFLCFVYPKVAEIRGWSIKRVLRTPVLLQSICGELDEAPAGVRVVLDEEVEELAPVQPDDDDFPLLYPGEEDHADAEREPRDHIHAD